MTMRARECRQHPCEVHHGFPAYVHWPVSALATPSAQEGEPKAKQQPQALFRRNEVIQPFLSNKAYRTACKDCWATRTGRPRRLN